MSLKHGILGLLSYGDMSGYDVMKVFNISLAFFWTAQTSQIYRELEAMEKLGWVKEGELRRRGHLEKKLYAITESGREELSTWLGDDSSGGAEPVRSAFLLRLFFHARRGPASLRELVEGRLKTAREARARLQAVLEGEVAGYEKTNPDPFEVFCWKEAAKFGLFHFDAQIRWAEECLVSIDSLNKGATK